MGVRVAKAYLAMAAARAQPDVLGWEARLESGEFGRAEVYALRHVSELAGQHSACAVVCQELDEIQEALGQSRTQEDCDKADDADIPVSRADLAREASIEVETAARRADAYCDHGGVLDIQHTINDITEQLDQDLRRAIGRARHLVARLNQLEANVLGVDLSNAHAVREAAIASVSNDVKRER